MEPEENVFTLDWLHECVQILDRYGINVIMCTPTATHPVWLTSTYADTLLVKSDGSKLEHGGRRHYCYSSDTYMRHTTRIVEKLTREFSKYENVVGWQIDNEPDLAETGGCYCENCQAKFQAWLKNRYQSIEELNKKWATGFWSMDYTDWRQIRLGQIDGSHYTSRALDTSRFFSEALGGYIIKQRELIKRIHPEAIISTNLNGFTFTSLDYYKIYLTMDIAMKDLYFDICTMDTNIMILDQFRSYKPGKKFWITETGAGMCGIGRPSNKDQFKAWMWSSFAHGADAYVVFRWRTCLSGQEQELEGMLEHSGHPGHRYKKVKAAFQEMREVSAKLGEIPTQEPEIAIVHDYEVMWGYQSNSGNKEIDYEKNFTRLYRELYRKQLSADIIATSSPLDKYKLIVLPSLYIIDKDFAEKLEKFVQKGGVVLAQGQIGMRDRNCNYLIEGGPHFLKNLLGVKINGGMYLFSSVEVNEYWNNRSKFTMKIAGTLDGMNVTGAASVWAGDIELNGGTALLTFSDADYAGQPVIIEKQSGKGTAIYTAAVGLDDALLEQLFAYSLEKAGIAVDKGIPEHVEVIRRGNYTFVINHLNEVVKIGLEGEYKAILGEITNTEVELKPYEVVILESIY